MIAKQYIFQDDIYTNQLVLVFNIEILKAKTMEMKLKSLEEEGIKETYTKEACVKLENVRRRLLSKIDMVTCEVRNIQTCSRLI